MSYLSPELCSSPSLRGPSFLAFLLLAVALLGCNSGSEDRYERVPASGSVTFEGQRVVDGQIRFAPQPGTKVPVVIEAIRDGQYTTEKSGGIPVGGYRVEIRAYDPNVPQPRTPEDRPRQQLP